MSKSYGSCSAHPNLLPLIAGGQGDTDDEAEREGFGAAVWLVGTIGVAIGVAIAVAVAGAF